MKKFVVPNLMGFILTSIILANLSCNTKKDYETILKNPILYANTVHELNTVVMGNNFGPIVASRNYLYANIAAYEVIAAGYPDQWTSLSGQLKGLGPVPRPAKNK